MALAKPGWALAKPAWSRRKETYCDLGRAGPRSKMCFWRLVQQYIFGPAGRAGPGPIMSFWRYILDKPPKVHLEITKPISFETLRHNSIELFLNYKHLIKSSC